LAQLLAAMSFMGISGWFCHYSSWLLWFPP